NKFGNEENMYNKENIELNREDDYVDRLVKEKAPEKQEQIITTQHSQVIELIKNNIDYNIIKEKMQENNQDYFKIFNSVYKIIVDVVSTNEKYIKINGELKSLEIVRSVFLKIKFIDIDKVINKFKTIGYKIKNFKAYMRTLIYNTYIDKDLYSINSEIKRESNTIQKNNSIKPTYKNGFVNYTQKKPDYNLLREIELMSLKEGTEEDRDHIFNGVKI
uniref:DUF6017 domain-containing protein n=1 Tax=uncultured Tyzzerella sp. TaxID=2321398 RepID=UPI0029430695